MASSQGGAGAYSQLVFDDSAGQPRIGLQRHADAHLGTAELIWASCASKATMNA